MPHHSRPYRVQLDVAVARERVCLRGDEAGAKASFPEAASPALRLIHVLGVALRKVFHEQSAAVLVARRDQQMDVVRHQAVGMYRASMLSGEEREVVEVDRVVAIFEETRSAV